MGIKRRLSTIKGFSHKCLDSIKGLRANRLVPYPNLRAKGSEMLFFSRAVLKEGRSASWNRKREDGFGATSSIQTEDLVKDGHLHMNLLRWQEFNSR